MARFTLEFVLDMKSIGVIVQNEREEDRRNNLLLLESSQGRG